MVSIIKKFDDYEVINDHNLKKILTKFNNPKKIGYFSTYKPNYTRTETLLELFNRNQVQVDKIIPGGGLIRYFKALFQLFQQRNNFDVLVVAFRGHEILPFVRLIFRKKIIYDSFISIYDTLCFDRCIFRPSSLIGKLLKWYDTFLCSISDFVLLDTKTHMNYFIKEFKVSKNKISYLYVGCNKKMFKPMKVKKDTNKFLVFWYGNVLPVQGVDVILKTAKALETEKNILFRLVGPIRKKYGKLIKELQLTNVEFIDYVPYEKLPQEIAKADLCLGGHFSDLPKAKRVIAGKTFQFLAMNKKTIITNYEANDELLILNPEKQLGLCSLVKVEYEKNCLNQ
ncbi:MAG TPA: glycosyltransferase [Candidatus Woesebacteria bacterium]|nr:glycosyltransferase [Candidatus Woesebacteria bacterium]